MLPLQEAQCQKILTEIASRVMILKDKSLGRGNASHSAIFSSERGF